MNHTNLETNPEGYNEPNNSIKVDIMDENITIGNYKIGKYINLSR